MAILHPQECYLLEKFILHEHYAATRDAIFAYINAHEAAFARYLREMPLNNRKLPLWQQADMVWGNRVLLNIRPMKERYMQVYILRTDNDIQVFNIGHAMSNIGKGIAECWDGWMTKQEIETISELQGTASILDQQLSTTISGGWEEGRLTYRAESIISASPLPAEIPRYELDHSVRIEANEKPVQTGIYLPDIDFAPACFIPASYHLPPEENMGIERSDYVGIDGKPGYSWKESEWAKTGWTLIRRVEGKYIDVPPGGFFPEGKPEKLYNWPQREIELSHEERERITCWSGAFAPLDGRWATIVNGTKQYIQIHTGQIIPKFEDKHGQKHPACWSLLERDDGGNVFAITPIERS
ncbi:type VI secretion protein ImpA [Pantoea agglomerans]|uniref:type VI secretion protein ImpA n=1 Tax=Enterobacter agglomerans TaxID=549 RepID=UPI003C7E2476